MKKVYHAHPEFISRDVETKTKHNTNELYELETSIQKAIERAVNWRADHFNEKWWQEALPQVLLNLLNSWDQDAAEVAVKSFLSKQEETKEVERQY